MSTKNPVRDDGRVDSRPCSDVDRCNAVGGASVAAPNALELTPRWPIGLVDMAARRASSGSVSRVHQNDRHTGELRFVGDELPELVERPRGSAAALSPANRCPLADAAQTFEGDRARGVLGLGHQFLGDAMVGIAPETLLVSRQALEMPLCGLRAAGLEFGAELCGLAAHFFNTRAGMRLSIGIDGDVHDAQVHAENALDLDRLGIWNVDYGAEIEHIIDKNEVGLTTNAVVQLGFEIVIDGHMDEGTSIEGQDGNSVQRLPTEYSLVVDHRAMRSEVRPDGPVELVGFDGFGDGANGHLGGQPELLAHGPIDGGLNLDLAGELQLKGHASDVVASKIEVLHRSDERGVLLRSRTELDFEGQIHEGIAYGLQYTYYLRPPIPPTAKACGLPWRQKVKKIGMRATELLDGDTEQLVIVPNNEMVNKRIMNMVEPDKRLRVLVKISTAYGSDVDKVSTILKQVALEHSNVLKNAEHQPVVRFSDFGDSSLMFKVFIYIDDVANRHKVTSEYRKAVYERFAAEGIEIPFPQRVVHFVDETKKSERN